MTKTLIIRQTPNLTWNVFVQTRRAENLIASFAPIHAAPVLLINMAKTAQDLFMIDAVVIEGEDEADCKMIANGLQTV